MKSLKDILEAENDYIYCITESLLDDDLVSKVNKKSILVGLLKDILNSKNKNEFYNNRNKLLKVISNNNSSPLTFGNQIKWAGHMRGEVWVTKGYFIEFNILSDTETGIKIGNMRKAIYISWNFEKVKINTTYGFNDYSSTIDYTFELPKELVKEYQILRKKYEKSN